MKAHDRCTTCGTSIADMSITTVYVRTPTPLQIFPHKIHISCSWECLQVLVGQQLGPSWKASREKGKGRKKPLDDVVGEA